MSKISQHVSELPAGARVITLDHKLGVESRTVVIHRCQVQGDWGFATGFVHLRVEDGEEERKEEAEAGAGGDAVAPGPLETSSGWCYVLGVVVLIKQLVRWVWPKGSHVLPGVAAALVVPLIPILYLLYDNRARIRGFVIARV